LSYVQILRWAAQLCRSGANAPGQNPAQRNPKISLVKNGPQNPRPARHKSKHTAKVGDRVKPLRTWKIFS